MTQHHGSETRQRQQAVLVRLSPAEMALVKAESARSKKSAAALLRDAFMASVKVEVPMRKFTRQPDQDYEVQMCRQCSHPGGLHVGGEGCLCGFCGGWKPGGMGRWNDPA